MASPSVDVSIVMPVYNAQRYVGRAIRSILLQTFTNFEFIIVDDCSTDESPSIITSFTDERICVLRNHQNQGLEHSLNRAIAAARGSLIARMDADDVSLPRRIAAQVAFMNKHPEVGMCGTYIKLIGDKTEVVEYYTDDAQIKANLLFETGMAHPTVMMRKSVIDQHQLYYETTYRAAEDYDLWIRAASVTKFANLPQVLLHYTIHPQSISQTRDTQQTEGTNVLRYNQLQDMGLAPSADQILLHQQICSFGFPRRLSTIKQIEAWFKLIVQQNKKQPTYEPQALQWVLSNWWYKVCRATTGQGLPVWRQYYHSTLRLPEKLPLRSLKILAKCLLRRK